MAEKLLKVKKHGVAARTDATGRARAPREPKKAVLVGTYAGNQLKVLEMSDGFDRKKLRNDQTWIDYRKEDLMADWQLACEGKKPLMILPLS